MKKVFFLILLLIFITPVYAKEFDNNINLIHEDQYNKEDAGSFSIYYKDINNNYNYYDTFYYDKNISTKTFNINKMIYGIKIIKESGYELNLDEVTINGITDNNYIRKLQYTDNDVIEVEDELYLDIVGFGKLTISGRSPLTLKGKEFAFKFPEDNYLKKIDDNSNYLNYEINSNYGDYNNYLFYHLDNVVTGSGHPTAPMDYYVSNDDEYLYIYTKAYIDNTFDHGKDYSKVYIKTSEGIKSYQVNTVEDNVYGEWYFKYTDNPYNINWEHMEYLIKVPMTDINDNKVGLLFEYYGTACVSSLEFKLRFNVRDDLNKPIEGAKFNIVFIPPETDDAWYDYGDDLPEEESKLNIKLTGTSDKDGLVEVNVDKYYFDYHTYCDDYIESFTNFVNGIKVNVTQIDVPEGYVVSEPIDANVELISMVDNHGREYTNLEELRYVCEEMIFTFNLLDKNNENLVINNIRIVDDEKPIPDNPKTGSYLLILLLVVFGFVGYSVYSVSTGKKAFNK